MSQDRLTLRSRKSPWVIPPLDITKGSVLSWENLDDNQIYLKGEIIYTGSTSGTDLILNKINGKTIPLDLSGIVSAADTFTTGATIINDIVYYNTTASLSAYTVDLSPYVDSFWSASTGTNAIVPKFHDTTASGTRSIAINNETQAIGDYSLAEGDRTIASGNSSHAEGRATSANGDYSHSEGISSKANGQASHAEGSTTIASGPGSHSEGITTDAGGRAAHAEGEDTDASGDNSHAGGISTTASGIASHSQNNGTIADGFASHAQNTSTSALGNNSHAGGAGVSFADRVVASGDTSFIHFKQTSDLIGTGVIGAFGDYSAILGGVNHNIGTGSTNSGIFVGSANTINDDVISSAIIAGSNITATTDNTGYVDNLNIVTLPPTDNTIDDILVRRSDGSVLIRNANTLSQDSKYCVDYNFTANTASIFTHGLVDESGDPDPCVLVEIWNLNDGKRMNGTVVNSFTGGTITITLTQTVSAKVVIKG
jgi:hypothetical protein